jgi:hypothetical protein
MSLTAKPTGGVACIVLLIPNIPQLTPDLVSRYDIAATDSTSGEVELSLACC